jgi:shikimate dehydrogenase
MSIRKACVIGHPISHSRSPLIHGYWLKTYGLEGSYVREDVAPAEFNDFIATRFRETYVGANVTLPHKEEIFKLVDQTLPRAQKLKAANTIWFEDGKLIGDNTDSFGFLANLDQLAWGWDRNLKKAVVLGAGGASASIIAALMERGASEIVLVNRSADKARAMAERFPDAAITVLSFDTINAALENADVLVNTTSLGMVGQPDLDIDLHALPISALVTDIVYVPLETTLLKNARLRGNKIVDGLGMLLHQARPGFERWFGKAPEVTDELRLLIEDDILKAQKK